MTMQCDKQYRTDHTVRVLRRRHLIHKYSHSSSSRLMVLLYAWPFTLSTFPKLAYFGLTGLFLSDGPQSISSTSVSLTASSGCKIRETLLPPDAMTTAKSKGTVNKLNKLGAAGLQQSSRTILLVTKNQNVLSQSHSITNSPRTIQASDSACKKICNHRYLA